MLWNVHHRKLLALTETGDTLTNSQRKVSREILKEIADYERRINLWGGPGAGKTFVSHYLHHQMEVLYFPSPESYQSSEISQGDAILIDNAPHDRQSARLIFGDILWSGASSVILITRQPIDDAVRRIKLSLNDADLKGIEIVMREQLGNFEIGDINRLNTQQSGIWLYLKMVIDNE